MRNLLLYFMGSLGLAVFSLPFLMNEGTTVDHSTDGQGFHSFWTAVGNIPMVPVAGEDDEQSTSDDENDNATTDDSKSSDKDSGSSDVDKPTNGRSTPEGANAPPVSTRRHQKLKIDLSDLVIRPV